MGLAALLLLLITVLVGFVKKLNVGLLAIAGAVVLGYGSGLFKGSKIISGFSANLFMILLGITLFFGIIQNNGCIELSMRKLVHICGHHVWLIPPLVYGVGFIFAAMGPGCVPAMAFAAAVAIPLAHETGYHPIMLLLLGNLGTYCGRFSPITPEGVLIQEILGNQGIVVPSSVLLLNTFLGTLLLSVLVFLFYKGYQVKAPEKSSKTVDELHFTGAQLVALGSVAVMDPVGPQNGDECGTGFIPDGHSFDSAGNRRRKERLQKCSLEHPDHGLRCGCPDESGHCYRGNQSFGPSNFQSHDTFHSRCPDGPPGWGHELVLFRHRGGIPHAASNCGPCRREPGRNCPFV